MRPEPPSVSMFVPAYRQEAFIAEALMSCVDQDYDNLEVLVRDDASPDGTADVIREIAARYPDRVRMLPGEVNLGITGNHNALMRACRGRYIGVIGGDDVALPGKVAAQAAWLEEDEHRVLCHHDVDVFDSDSGRTLYRYSERIALRTGSARQLLRYPAFCAAPSVMLRASAVPSTLYDARIAHSSDWLLWMETLVNSGLENAGAGIVPGVYVRYRRHAGNVTKRANDYVIDETMLAFDILEEYAPALIPAIRSARSERMATYGFRMVLAGRPDAGASLVWRAMQHAPSGVARAVANGISYARTAFEGVT